MDMPDRDDPTSNLADYPSHTEDNVVLADILGSHADIEAGRFITVAEAFAKVRMRLGR